MGSGKLGSKSWSQGGWSEVGGFRVGSGRLGSEGMVLGSKGFKSRGWGRGGQRSWGAGVKGVMDGAEGVWVKESRRSEGFGCGSGVGFGKLGSMRSGVVGVGGIEVREVGIREVVVGGYLGSKKSGSGGFDDISNFFDPNPPDFPS